jgi:hypothetical protein
LVFAVLSSHIPSVGQSLFFGTALFLDVLELGCLVRRNAVAFDVLVVFGCCWCVLVLQVESVGSHHIRPASSHDEG